MVERFGFLLPVNLFVLAVQQAQAQVLKSQEDPGAGGEHELVFPGESASPGLGALFRGQPGVPDANPAWENRFQRGREGGDETEVRDQQQALRVPAEGGGKERGINKFAALQRGEAQQVSPGRAARKVLR